MAAHAPGPRQVFPVVRSSTVSVVSPGRGKGTELVGGSAVLGSASECREQPGDKLLERVLEIWQTGADDTAVGLNGTPQQGVPGSPGWVVRVDTLHQRVDTNNASNADEKTKGEHQHDTNLADLVQLQPGQQGHGEQTDPNVGRRSITCPPPSEPGVVDACGVNFFMP